MCLASHILSRSCLLLQVAFLFYRNGLDPGIMTIHVCTILTPAVSRLLLSNPQQLESLWGEEVELCTASQTGPEGHQLKFLVGIMGSVHRKK